MDAHNHPAASGHVNPYLLAAVGAASALTLAPYVLPPFGLGTLSETSLIMHGIGGHATVDAATGIASSYGTGLAGGIASGIAQVPMVGSWLTSAAPVTLSGLGWSVTTGALASLAAVAGIGIGGVLLANWLEKREAPDAPVRWSRIIRYAALATSALIALPAILSGISTGIAFLSFIIGGYGAAGQATMILQQTLGATSMGGEVATGVLGMVLPHLLACGSALLPLMTGFFMGHHAPAATVEMGATKAMPIAQAPTTFAARVQAGYEKKSAAPAMG